MKFQHITNFLCNRWGDVFIDFTIEKDGVFIIINAFAVLQFAFTQLSDNLRDEMKESVKERIFRSYVKHPFRKSTKGCLSLFNYFIDMSPTLLSPFFVEKTWFFSYNNMFF